MPDFCLRDILIASEAEAAGSLQSTGAAFAYRDLLTGTCLAGARKELHGKSVLIAPKSQLASATALIELDGIASRLVICPPDFTPFLLSSVIKQAEVDAVVYDGGSVDDGSGLPHYFCGQPAPADADRQSFAGKTEWVLPTSGTTGPPKLVAHTLTHLLGAIQKPPAREPRVSWATFYDIRRFGGMQIFLRAVSGSHTLVISEPDEPQVDFLRRCQAAGVTHMSGTPSHWRRLLMSPHANLLSLRYIRLSGEIADRAILESLRATYPEARIVHAFASTEAGVAFEVTDEQEGFPASFINENDQENDQVGLRVEDGSLRVRSRRTALRYIGRGDLKLHDEDGFVDTDDLIELQNNRYYFKGRRAGVINIGGLKVHPEEVESVINLHPRVSMSLVRARRNPIMGNIITAYVVLDGKLQPIQADAVLKSEILAVCGERLERHKIPAVIDFVASLDVLGSGKLARNHA
ncbi:MAG TPA: fatty acid--CoA ligase family protein [Methylocella sp.]|nr:fatty acid--CoA ligase family protein [Methylocella sp.]